VSRHHLDQLLATLRRIAELVPDSLDAWREDELRQLAVERLWITAGNLADAHRLTAGIETGVGPWAELHRFRSLLAHALPGDLSEERVWYESVTDLPRLTEQVQRARG
jgi:uncharacterized protein with HEPN domain